MYKISKKYFFAILFLAVMSFSYQPHTAEASFFSDLGNALSNIGNAISNGLSNLADGIMGNNVSNSDSSFCGSGCGSSHTTMDSALAAAQAQIAGNQNASILGVTQANDGTWTAMVAVGGSDSIATNNPPGVGTVTINVGRPWILASPCVVALGTDACLSNMSWSFERVIGQRVRSARQGWDSSFHGTHHFSHANSGSEPRWVTFSYNHFALYHDSRGRRGAPLASTVASLSCAAGSPQFDGSTTRCLCPAGQTPSGDNTSCILPDGTPAPGPGSGPSSGPSNTGTPGPIGNPTPPPPPPPPPNNVSSVTISLDTNIVRSGTPGGGTVTVDSTGGASCVLSPASVTTNGSTTFMVGAGNSQTFDFTTFPLQNQLRVSVNCTPTAGAFTPGTSGADFATIEVIPQINEI